VVAIDQDGVRVIRAAGHIRMGEAVDHLRADVDASLAAGNAKIVVDMTEVRSLDSSAIGVLVRSLSLAKQKGGSLKLANVPQGVRESLTITGILRLFEIFEDGAKAVASFGG